MLDTTHAIRLALVYVHLIACAVALGAIVSGDVCMMSRILKGERDHLGEERAYLKSIVPVAILVLWSTGIFFIWQDASTGSLEKTLSNPKLQAKIVVVMVLTLNSLILHYRAFPLLELTRSLIGLRLEQRLLVIEASALSSVSWLYAAFLGVARPLSWKFSLDTLLVAYPVLTSLGFGVAWCLISCALHRRREIMQDRGAASASISGNQDRSNAAPTMTLVTKGRDSTNTAIKTAT